MVLALQKWRGYLLDRHFRIKIDHFSLKYVLDQRITTPFQSKWLPKLLGFDFEIKYKKGKENLVVDASSRVERTSELFQLLSTTTSNNLVDAVVLTWTSDPHLKKVIEGLYGGYVINITYTWNADKLRRNGKWVLGDNVELRQSLIAQFHGSAIGGHSGVFATTQGLTTYFY